MNLSLHARAERSEANLVLSWAASELTKTERIAIEGYLIDEPEVVTGERIGLTRGGIWMAKQSALRKIRKRLTTLGIKSTRQLIS